MAVNKDAVIEIAQVHNGFIIRNAPGNWFGEDRQRGVWNGAQDDYLVFRTMAELQDYIAAHFSYRAKVSLNDSVQTIKMDKKAA
jgi:hypothetical protein